MLVHDKAISVINASIAQEWAKDRDYNVLPNRNPGVINSYIENGESSNQIGCVRNFNREDGIYFREQLLALDDREHICTYTVLESNTPMEDYFCTLKLLPITDGDRTYIEWLADFKCLPEEAWDLQNSLEKVFQVGFDALNQLFAPIPS